MLTALSLGQTELSSGYTIYCQERMSVGQKKNGSPVCKESLISWFNGCRRGKKNYGMHATKSILKNRFGSPLIQNAYIPLIIFVQCGTG